MPIARLVRDYLQQQGIDYDVVPHPRAFDSMTTAARAHVPGDRLVKSVVLHDENGYLLAVLPSTHRIEIGALEAATQRHLALANELELQRLFWDCDMGAVPPLGGAYGLPTVVDDSVTREDDVYFEAGDHTDLVHVSGDAFRSLMSEAAHARFSRHV